MRRIEKPPDPEEDILIADSGADQIILGVVWRVLKNTSQYVNLLGPLAGRHQGAIFNVVSAAAKLIDENGQEWCAIAHEGLMDRDKEQKESLLASAQDTPYENTERVITRRLSPEEIEWKRRLGFPPDKVVKAILQATTQMIPLVEAESREIMRDHLKSRLPMLRLQRRNETNFLDTFKSSVTSVRGYKYFNLFAAEKSLYDNVHLMMRKSDSPATIKDHFLCAGAPHTLKSDNAMEFKSDKVKKILREAYVEPLYTEPHHPQQNLAEARGGRLKHAVQHLLTVTQAPLEFLCYALEYLAYLRQRTSRKKLKNRTSIEAITGGIPDISKACFTFWQPIWFYTPRRPFPRQQMLPARFLGFSENSGDAFTDVIAVEPEKDGEMYQVYTRSVIRPRYLRKSQPSDASLVIRNEDKLEIYGRDGKTPLQYEEDPDDVIELDPSKFPHNPLPQDNTVEPSHLEVIDKFEDAIHAVYGPPAEKRLRIDDSSSIPLQTADRFQIPSSQTEENVDPHEQPKEVNPHKVAQGITIPQVPAATETPVPGVPHREPATVTQQDDDDQSVDLVASSEETDEMVTPDSVDTYLKYIAGDDGNMCLFDSIIGHEFWEGELYLKVQWRTNDVSMEVFRDVREDYPYETAIYI
ncbi:unnamed protein product [Cylindrotheca closterium]|uniref:Integrase catalytic domain-containing protein n=1 Tax=Cylindrotheca closterium TaxID=2856 RepID=A0AAD2FSF0_9STRA|nr:unnamed protein product [Cylindrotheca closterium]